MACSRWLLGGMAALLSCNVADPRPDPLGAPQEPQHSGEQAEVATALALTPGAAQVLLAGYRYTGSHTLPASALNDIDYLPGDGVVPGDGVTIRRGASIAGWSYSLNGGTTWTAPGKLYPEEWAPPYSDPVAVLWSDPSLMAGFKSKSLVAYSNLGISTPAFDKLAGTDDALHFFPAGGAGGNLVDSVCVSLSVDGGQSFYGSYCRRPPDVGSLGTDQTAVGIDKADRIFVATDDYADNKIDLYQLTFVGPSGQFGGFRKLAIDPQMGLSSRTPRIARDQDGNVVGCRGESFFQDLGRSVVPDSPWHLIGGSRLV